MLLRKELGEETMDFEAAFASIERDNAAHLKGVSRSVATLEEAGAKGKAARE